MLILGLSLIDVFIQAYIFKLYSIYLKNQYFADNINLCFLLGWVFLLSEPKQLKRPVYETQYSLLYGQYINNVFLIYNICIYYVL